MKKHTNFFLSTKAKSVSALLLIALLLSISILPTIAQQPVFRIGVLDSEQGQITRSAQLAIQQINADGGVVGADGTRFRLELVIQSPDNLATAVQNINQASVIAVLGPETTEQVLNGMGNLRSLNVPILTPAIGDTIIVQDTTQRLFRVRAQEVFQGRALANYLVTDIGVQSVTTVQLDVESTAGVIGFSTALSPYGVGVNAQSLLNENQTIAQLASSVALSAPRVIVAFGPPDMARQLYVQLRSSNWAGLFVYSQANHENFRESLTPAQLNGIISTTTWAFDYLDDTSNAFLNIYIRAFGEIPSPVAAAIYDGIQMLATSIGQPGDLTTNLTSLNNIEGVQGILNPAALTRGETSTNTAITMLNEFGSAQTIARYLGNQRLPDEVTDITIPTPTPAPTATPDGVAVTIQSAVQNVRSGPGLNYDVLGQLREGEQVEVIGSTADTAWVVVNFRGQQGWMATYLLEVFGDLRTVAIINPPPTPTPAPPTATPTPSPIPDIVITAASPNRITIGVPFSVVVTVRNQGSANAGGFAVAATFEPDGVYSAVNIPTLAAGTQTNVTLTGTLNSTTGQQTVVIVADLNNQVNEGPNGEANNTTFQYTYTVDRPVTNTGTITMNQGSTLNLEGSGLIDILWDVSDNLIQQNGTLMYVMSGITSLDQVHYDKIDPALATPNNINAAVLPNAYIGVITAEGNRGVLRVDSVVTGGPLTLTYRVYAPVP